MRVLRLCSVFEPTPEVLAGKGRRFDPIGGMQNHTAELTRALDRRGVAQKVVTTRPPGAPSFQRVGELSEVFRLGLPFRPLRQLYSVSALPLAYRLSAASDLVHVHQGEDLAALPIAFAAAAARRLPLVVTIHCSLRFTLLVVDARTAVLKTLGGWIEKQVSSRAQGVIAITPRLTRHLLESGAQPESVHTIPPGVDHALFAGDHPDPFPSIARPRVLFVGRLTSQKGVYTLLEAAGLLRTSPLDVVFVGDGPERDRLERRIDLDGMTERVHVTGFIPHELIPAALRNADVLVLPSLYEELGSVLIEALHAGLPIVASRTGAIPEIVSHGENGLLVSPGDAAELAEAIDRLLHDPALLLRMRAAARAKASDYDWDDVAARVLHVYERALARRVSAPGGAGSGR